MEDIPDQDSAKIRKQIQTCVGFQWIRFTMVLELLVFVAMFAALCMHT